MDLMGIGVAQPPVKFITFLDPRQDRLYLVVLIPEKTEHCKQRLAEHNVPGGAFGAMAGFWWKKSVYFTSWKRWFIHVDPIMRVEKPSFCWWKNLRTNLNSGDCKGLGPNTQKLSLSWPTLKNNIRLLSYVWSRSCCWISRNDLDIILGWKHLCEATLDKIMLEMDTSS